MTTYGVDRTSVAGGAGTSETAVPVTTVDAKGDLIVGTAADAVDNLPVGANGTILVADSGETLGMKWAAGDVAFEAIVDGGTAEASPAVGDLVMISDVSVNTGRKMTLENMFKVVDGFTPLAELDTASDKLPVYDASAGGIRSMVPTSFFRKNLLINGAFEVAQRGTSFTSATTPANSDDTYLLDRWTLLSDGNDIVDVTQNASVVPTGGLYTCALDVETANKKFGIIQFIEQKNCYRAFGGTVSLSFKARKGAANATVNTMRAVVLSWDGTADTLTSDVVSAWGASGVNPTLAANWTAENVATDLTLTDSFQTFKINGISADTASAKNLAVFLYYNDADGTVGDFIYVTDVQLEVGSVATEFETRTFQDELALCQRYYETGSFHCSCIAGSSASRTYAWPIPFHVTKFAAPTVTPATTTNARCTAAAVASTAVDRWSVSTTNSNTDFDDFSLVGTFTAAAEL